MKKNFTKNYIILFIILTVTVFLVFYMRSWYNTSKIYYSQNSIIKDVVPEINYDEIFNYTLESQKFMLYVSAGSNNEIKNFERDLKKVVTKLDLTEDILYLNLDNVNVNEFSSNLKNSFAASDTVRGQISDSSVTTIYVFENGKIVSVLNNVNRFSAKQLETFIKKSGFDD